MMRDKRLVVLVMLVVGVLAISGCGGATVDEEAGTESEAVAAETSAVEIEGLPEVDLTLAKTGWALVQDKCIVCHPVTTIDEARLGWEDWEKAINHMLENGAQLNDSEKAAVLEYLGTRDQVQLYGASHMQQACMVCHTTERVSAAVLDWAGWEAAVDHMIENGADIDPARRAVIVEYLAIRGPQG
jgi:hypothetical protein